MTPAQARLKRKVREAVERCGGVDGAAATVERGRSVCGDWGNLAHKAFPPLDCALALDEVAVAQGQAPAILAGYAAALGHVCIRLPDPASGEDALTRSMLEASAEFGDVAHAVRDAIGDGELTRVEREAIAGQIDEAMASLAKLRALALGEVQPLRAVRDAEAG